MVNEATAIIEQIETNFTALPELCKQYCATMTNSTRARNAVAYRLVDFFNFVAKDPADINIDDWDAYAKHLNAMDLSKSSKLVYFAQINSFFDYAEVRLQREHTTFKNPLPKAKWAGLTEHSSKRQVKNAKIDKLLSRETLQQILEIAHKQSLRNYIFYLLKIHTGARTGEILRLRLRTST